jgi:hypothetical protein
VVWGCGRVVAVAGGLGRVVESAEGLPYRLCSRTSCMRPAVRSCGIWWPPIARPRHSAATRMTCCGGPASSMGASLHVSGLRGWTSVTRMSAPGRTFLANSINHQPTVLSSFHDFALEMDLGPLVNPVPLQRGVHAHHRPGRAFRTEAVRNQPCQRAGLRAQPAADALSRPEKPPGHSGREPRTLAVPAGAGTHLVSRGSALERADEGSQAGRIHAIGL